MITRCFRLMSGARSATADLSGLDVSTLFGASMVVGQVRILFDDGALVTANWVDDVFPALVDFEGEEESFVEYAEMMAEDYAVEIARRLERPEAPHVIATQNDVEHAADLCWAA